MSGDTGNHIQPDLYDPKRPLPQPVAGNYYASTHVSGGNVLQGDNYGCITFSSDSSPRPRSLAETLWFPEINSRLNEIKDAKHGTYEWILKELPQRNCEHHEVSDAIALRNRKACGLRGWLESGSRIYSIQGKAGSGKSTLMKFLFEHPLTIDRLESSDDTKLIPNRVFHSFWRVGCQVQCSLKGFLASILFQILTEQPGLEVFCDTRSRGQHTKRSFNDWSERDLSASLLATIANTSKSLCIFVNGIDELHPDDDIHELVQLLTEISAMAHCKLCVSSRPLPPIIRYFKDAPNVRLQDLTREDIRVYIDREIETNLKLSPHEISSSETSDLIDLISAKAEGVFVWVHLVVKDVVRGVLQGDDLPTLKQRVDIMPSQIEKLYQHMLARHSSDGKVYVRKAALILSFGQYFPMHLFRLAVATDHALTESVLADQQDLSLIDVDTVCDRLAGELATRCAGLVECVRITHASGYDAKFATTLTTKAIRSIPRNSSRVLRVQYIHRSVQEFLSDTVEGQEVIHQDGRLRWDEVQLALVKAALVCVHLGIHELRPDYIRGIFSRYLYDAGEDMAPILETIDCICRRIVRTMSTVESTGEALTKSDWSYEMCILYASKAVYCNKWSLFASFDLDFPGVVSNLSSVSFISYLLQTRAKTWSSYYKGHIALLGFGASAACGWSEEKGMIHGRGILSLCIARGADMMSNQTLGLTHSRWFHTRSPAVEYLAKYFTFALNHSKTIEAGTDVLKLIRPFLEQERGKVFCIKLQFEKSQANTINWLFGPHFPDMTSEGDALLLTFQVMNVLQLLQDLFSRQVQKEGLAVTTLGHQLGLSRSSCKGALTGALATVESIYRVHERKRSGCSCDNACSCQESVTLLSRVATDLVIQDARAVSECLRAFKI